MDPVIYKLSDSFEIRWYGVMAALGFIAAVLVALKNRKIAEMSKDQVYNLLLLTMLSGVVGARIFYIISFWERDGFGKNPLTVFLINKGGLVYYGGFILAFITIFVYSRRSKLNFMRVIDMMAPSLALGHAISRVGCFLNGCCYGKATSMAWGHIYPASSAPGQIHPGVALHPVQLYETFGNLIIFVILQKFLHKSKCGQTAALYLILYGVLRFLDEFFRGDHAQLNFGLFTPAQTICLFIIPAGIALYIYSTRKAQNVGTDTSV